MALVVMALAAVVGCGDDGGGPNDRPGQSAVYERIDGLTNCGQLQAEFDRASANNGREDPGSTGFDITLSYMQAADERMSDLGCYDG